MEEDIKILEEMVELNKSKLAEYKSTGVWYNEDTEMYTNCIENLIKGYRELERYYEEQNEVNAKFIPKSKIKEYIDKIQKELDKRKVKEMYIAIDGDVTDDDINTWIIQRATLQELMEDK